jgi:hypothetical protein
MKRKATNQGQAGGSTCPRYASSQGTLARGSSEQQSQQIQATPRASTPVGPVAPNASTKTGHALNVGSLDIMQTTAPTRPLTLLLL